jgi:hypothetical protein
METKEEDTKSKSSLFRRRIRLRDHVPYRNSTPQERSLLSHSTEPPLNLNLNLTLIHLGFGEF